MLHQFFIVTPNFGGLNSGDETKKASRESPNKNGGLTKNIEKTWNYPAWSPYKKLLNMAIEIVDLSIKNADFP